MIGFVAGVVGAFVIGYIKVLCTDQPSKMDLFKAEIYEV